MNAADLYIDLMIKCLTRIGFGAPPERYDGLDWPDDAETMIGVPRLLNIVELTRSILDDEIPGDLLEAGVWRGGATILMRAVLAAFDEQRTVWVADSFNGLPRPDPSYPKDAGDPHWSYSQLKVNAEEVRSNFRRYGLLEEWVQFIPGWFKDTLPGPVTQLALLRSDGDMYGSTWETLEALYPLLSVGGYVILDDYFGAENGCHVATNDYRAKHDITESLVQIDHSGGYWRRER
jgi:O-methyltransferase